MPGRRRLPSFQEMRARAYGLLGDVEDELRSDWQPGTEPTSSQAKALAHARRHIALAKHALNRAAQP